MCHHMRQKLGHLFDWTEMEQKRIEGEASTDERSFDPLKVILSVTSCFDNDIVGQYFSSEAISILPAQLEEEWLEGNALPKEFRFSEK